MHIFDNDNFSIIPKSIFLDNDNLLISCKNADISAIDNFFDNIARRPSLIVTKHLLQSPADSPAKVSVKLRASQGWQTLVLPP